MTNQSTDAAPARIRLGVSTCLLGQNVRYDGQHKRDRYLCDQLGALVDFVPICPEHEAGFGIPREAMRLVGNPDDPRLYTVRTHHDVTHQMLEWIDRRLPELDHEDLDGFVFKSKSPSSGMLRVKVYPSPDGGMPRNSGIGLFARAFIERFPLLPTEEEGRLHDPDIRENFIERIFVMNRWHQLTRQRPAKKEWLAFHERHKLLVMSHDPATYKRLGPMLSHLKGPVSKRALDIYISTLMNGLKKRATPARHINVLQHITGYFKSALSSDEKQECLELFKAYRAGHIPLIVPVTLMNHYVRKFGVDYLTRQYYLHPHPVELALRNHV